jgi:hypothetical protein
MIAYFLKGATQDFARDSPNENMLEGNPYVLPKKRYMKQQQKLITMAVASLVLLGGNPSIGYLCVPHESCSACQ